jgi:hypothetical protein
MIAAGQGTQQHPGRGAKELLIKELENSSGDSVTHLE